MGGKWAIIFSFVQIGTKMKRFLSIMLLLSLTIGAKAQKNYFIYLQTDNKQSFYVKMNGKLMSSSGAGYLVISKLMIGDHSFIVGFPKEQWPQQNFAVHIENTDAGYLLKNFGEKGWGLYNMQSMEVVMNVGGSGKQMTTIENDDAFAKTLSGAANTEIVVKKEPIPILVKKEVEPIVVKEEVKKEVQADKPSVKVSSSSIQKIDTRIETDGLTIRYKVKTDEGTEIVPVFIENEKSVVVKEKKVEKPIIASEKKEKFLDIELPNPNTKKEVESPKSERKGNPAMLETKPELSKPLGSLNADCKVFATEEDFFKARKKMVVEDNDDAMVEVASKLFKQKCYSVEQVKNLSLLFLNDAGKYKFFDAVYAYTSDIQNFASLEGQLKDEYYIKRFKVMLRN